MFCGSWRDRSRWIGRFFSGNAVIGCPERGYARQHGWADPCCFFLRCTLTRAAGILLAGIGMLVDVPTRSLIVVDLANYPTDGPDCRVCASGPGEPWKCGKSVRYQHVLLRQSRRGCRAGANLGVVSCRKCLILSAKKIQHDSSRGDCAWSTRIDHFGRQSAARE